MIVLILILVFAVAAVALLIYTARHVEPITTPAVPQAFSVESFFDLNARHFAQIQKALSEDDYHYLLRRGPTRLARRLRRERLEALASYVHGLREDFENLLHLRGVVARLAAEVVRQHEPQVLLLKWQFRLLYMLVSAKLALARLTLAPVDVEPLVSVVNRMAQAMEAALNQLAENQVQKLGAELT